MHNDSNYIQFITISKKIQLQAIYNITKYIYEIYIVNIVMSENEKDVFQWNTSFVVFKCNYASFSLHTSTQASAFENLNSSSGVNSIALLDEPQAGKTVSNLFTLSSM